MQRLRGLSSWVAVATLCAPTVFAADKEKTRSELEAEKIVAAGREESLVMEHLDTLSNRIGPRLTSSDGLQNACEWARDRFASYGLEARLEEWGTLPVGFNRGPWSGRIVEPNDHAQPLEFTTMSWSAGTKGVTRGKAVLAPTNEKELEAIKADLPGAWVFATGQFPGPGTAFGKALQAAFEEAKIAGTVRTGRGDTVITAGPQYRSLSWEKLPTVPSVTLVKKQFDEIITLLKQAAAYKALQNHPDKAKFEALLTAIKEPAPVVLEFDIRNYFKKGPIKLYNVIADIPGSEKPDEYVIVGGHIDSWDGATGTTDNGTGCATAIEAARILMKSGVKPKRTVRFMLWSGEEQGLLGSAAYVKAHPELMPKISAVLVHDGGTNYLGGIGATEAMLSDLTQVFTPVMSLDAKLPFEVSKVAGLSGGGSDHASFLAANVPGFFWRQRGTARYPHTHHTQFDTFDAAIPDYQKHSSLVIAIGADGIANLDHLLSREKLRAPGGGFGGNRRLLGVALDEMTVTEVTEGSVAFKAGIKVGDVLVKVGTTKIADRMELTQALRGEPKKAVTVLRNGKEVELAIDFGPEATPRPTAPGNP